MPAADDSTANELWAALARHVRAGTADEEDTDRLKRLVDILGVGRVSKRTAYRGIILYQDTMDKVLSNKPFSLKSRRHVESWSARLGVALSFATLGKSGVGGIVLAAKPRPKDGIVHITTELLDAVKEWSGRSVHNHEEDEIVLLSRPGRRYTLCRNVPYIVMRARAMTVNDRYPTQADDDKDKLRARIMSRAVNAYELEEEMDEYRGYDGMVLLSCDGRGRLKYLPPIRPEPPFAQFGLWNVNLRLGGKI